MGICLNNTMSESIAKVFDIEHHEVEAITKISDSIADAPTISDQVEDDDFAEARKTTYELIEMGKAAMHTAMRIAAESENPRAIEVLSGLLKNLSDVNGQLLELSKKRIEIKNNKLNKSNGNLPQIGNVQNALFVGNGADLNKMIANKMKELSNLKVIESTETVEVISNDK